MLSTKIENVIINILKYVGILSENKNKRIGEKRQISRVVDEISITGLQDLEQYHKLNPINIKIDDSQIISYHQNTENII